MIDKLKSGVKKWIQCDCGEWIETGIVNLDDGDFIYQCPNCGEQRLYG